MKRTLFAALILMTAAACQPLPSAAPASEPPSQSEAATACASRGGVLQPVGRAQTMQCVIAFADAGKRCTTGADCAGDCRVDSAPFPQAGSAAVGRCQADSRPFGCHARVESGRATPAICVD